MLYCPLLDNFRYTNGHMLSHSSPHCTQDNICRQLYIDPSNILKDMSHYICSHYSIRLYKTYSGNHLSTWCNFHCNSYCIPFPKTRQHKTYIFQCLSNTFGIDHRTYWYKFVPNNHVGTHCNILSSYDTLNLSMHCYSVYNFHPKSRLYILRMPPSTFHMTPLNSQKGTFCHKMYPRNPFYKFGRDQLFDNS